MNANVVFVAPAEGSQGGISAVIDNYKVSKFWSRCNCLHYSSSIENDSRVYALLYQVWRIIGFLVFALLWRPCVASIHTASRNSFYRSFVYVAIARLARVPVVLHIHPAYFYEFYRQGGRLTKLLVDIAGKMSEKIVFLTPSIRDLFVSVFPCKDLLVVPNPVNVNLFCSDGDAPKRRQRQLLFMGWIVREKGVYEIVDVIPDVIAKFPDAVFIFAGNKEVDHLRSIIHQRGLDKAAKVLGWVSGQEKLDLLKESGMLLLPSYSEGVPNVILEAMASGLPVITTPVGGIPDVVKDSLTGIFVPPRDKVELREAILKLLHDEILCKNMSVEAQRQAREQYDVEVIGRMLEEIYRGYMQ